MNPLLGFILWGASSALIGHRFGVDVGIALACGMLFVKGVSVRWY